jgi:hypothetical protein
MNGLFRSTKFKAIIVPIMILILFSSLLMTHVLTQEQKPPSKGWSRAIYLNSTLRSESHPLVNYENHNYHIFTVASKNQVKDLVLNSNLETTGTESYNVSIPIWSSYWTDGQQFIFIKNHNLVTYKNGKTQIILHNVNGLVAQDNNVILWNSNRILSYSPATNTLTSLATTQYPIEEVFSKKGTDTLLVQSPLIENKQLYVGVLTKKDRYIYHTIDTISATPDVAVGDFDFVINDNVMNVVYMEYMSTNGRTSRINYLATYDLTTFKKKAATETLNIKNSVSQLTFTAPTNLKINRIHNQLMLLFQESGPLSQGVEAQNIFLAKMNKSSQHWTAIPVTSTLEPSADPVWLNDNTILWNDLNNGKYQLLLASQEPQIIQKGSHVIQKDWSNAISRTLINLSVSFLVFGYALMWACPTGIFIIAMSMGNMTMMERNPRWVNLVGVLAYLVTQLLTIKELFGSVFTMYAPQYLIFTGNFFIVPIALGVISWLLTQYVKSEEWGNSQFIFYCLLLDALMLGFLIGPYTL